MANLNRIGKLINIGLATERFFIANEQISCLGENIMTDEDGSFEIRSVSELLEWFNDGVEESKMKEFEDFMKKV